MHIIHSPLITMLGRSREGAWIEIHCAGQLVAVDVVAPARERGLKLLKHHKHQWHQYVAPARERGLKSRSWQEVNVYHLVAPARERGLKLMKVKQMTIKHCRSREGAWIEICPSSSPSSASSVAPARERGLKCLPVGEGHVGLESLPRGSVD